MVCLIPFDARKFSVTSLLMLPELDTIELQLAENSRPSC
jgi:hypothetical protein